MKNADAKTSRETIQSKIEACFASFLEVKHPSIMLHIFYQKVLGNTFLTTCKGYFIQNLKVTTQETPISASKKAYTEAAGDREVLHISSKELERHLSHTIGNTLNELIFGMTYKETDSVWKRIQYLREEGIKVYKVYTSQVF